MIDMASVYAKRFERNPQMLQAAVMGQSPDPKLDPYTALNALRLIKESNAMAMAGKAQQPTSAPSILADALAPPAISQGLAGMMPMGAPAGQMPQGQPMAQGQPMPQPQQAPVQQASGGLAGMPVHDQDYANGGIVAFANRGLVEGSEELTVPPDTPFDPNETGVYVDDYSVDDSAGNPNAQTQFNRMLMQQISDMRRRDSRVTTPEDAAKQEEAYYQRELRRAGPDIYAPELARGAEYETDRRKSRNSGEAMALLTAAGKILKGHTLAMGASEALPAYAQQMNEVERADAAAKSANAKMQFALKDAQRKERVGNSRAAQASMELYRKFQQDENKAEFDRDNAIANLTAKGIVGNRPTGKGAGAGAGPKVAERLADAEIAYAQNPTKENMTVVKALRATQAQLAQRQTFSSSLSDNPVGGPKAEALKNTAEVNRAQLNAKQNNAVMKEMNTWEGGREARKAIANGTIDAARAAKKEALRQDALRGVFDDGDESPLPQRLGTTAKPIKLD